MTAVEREAAIRAVVAYQWLMMCRLCMPMVDPSVTERWRLELWRVADDLRTLPTPADLVGEVFLLHEKVQPQFTIDLPYNWRT